MLDDEEITYKEALVWGIAILVSSFLIGMAQAIFLPFN
jgi:hypothetical protein